GHSWKFLNVNAFDFLQKVLGKALEGVEDVLLFHKGHFTIDLGEFRLPVRTEVFVPKAFYDLEIFVHAAHHQQLFEGLGGLWKGIELSFVHSAWHQKVTGTLWCGLDQIWGLHIDKALVRKVFSDFHAHLVPENEIVFYRVPADIQIAVLHANVFPTIG